MFTKEQIAAKRAAVTLIAGVQPSQVQVDAFGDAYVDGERYRKHKWYVLALKALVMHYLFGHDSNIEHELPRRMPNVAKALFSGQILMAAIVVANAINEGDARVA